LVAILLLAVGGSIFQFRAKNEEDEERAEEDPNNRYGMLGDLN